MSVGVDTATLRDMIADLLAAAERELAIVEAVSQKNADAHMCAERCARVAVAQRDTLAEAIRKARRELWWFIERDTGEGWGFVETDVDEIAARAMVIQDETLAAALAAVAPTKEAARSADVDTARLLERARYYQRVSGDTLVGEVADALVAALNRLAAAEAQRDTLAEALVLARDLLIGEGYDRDPDYMQEWNTISAALTEDTC